MMSIRNQIKLNVNN